MPIPFAVLGFGVAAAVLLASSGGHKGARAPTFPAPKRVGRVVAQYTPPTLRATAAGPPPQRDTIPALQWSAFDGALTILSIRKQDGGARPGFDRIELAELYAGAGPVRVYCDAYMVDDLGAGKRVGSSASIVVNAARAHLHSGAPLDDALVTEQAERIVRVFAASNDGLVEGLQLADPIEHNERNPPPDIPAFWGARCRIGGADAQNILYHYDDCRGSFYEREGKRALAYEPERTYNLSLEVRSGRVVLTASVMRLPVEQKLQWRAYAAAERI